MEQKRERTAVVIGSGIAGPAAALALAKAGISATLFEARPGPSDQEGGWLSLAPNGLNALKVLGVADALARIGVPIRRTAFRSHSGGIIGEIDGQSEQTRAGVTTLAMRRGLLHRELREAAHRHGIGIAFGKRLTGIEEHGDRVRARFADGTAAEADLLLGCDGIHSRTRAFVVPSGPGPVFTGLFGFSGFSHPAPTGAVAQRHELTFGRRALFGAFTTPGGEVWWFDGFRWPKDRSRASLEAAIEHEWRQRLVTLHADDPPPIPQIVARATGEVSPWIIDDLPPLPTWHRGRVCLVGDAAHATSPHSGQGASMAIEDAVVLAACLRDAPGYQAAFAAYESARKARVERQAREARQRGRLQIVANPIAAWVRDRLLAVGLRRGGSDEWLSSYTIDWDAPRG